MWIFLNKYYQNNRWELNLNNLLWNRTVFSKQTTINISIFQENKYIHTLKLSSNGLAYEGAVALSRVLKHNKILKEIDISDNRICWKGALVLSKGLQVNKTLEVLKVCNGCFFLHTSRWGLWNVYRLGKWTRWPKFKYWMIF